LVKQPLAMLLNSSHTIVQEALRWSATRDIVTELRVHIELTL